MVDKEQNEEEELEPTPYQNEYRRTLLDSDEEETEELNLSDLPEEANTQQDEGLISKKQEHDWQKRYSDLKSYHDRQRNEWQQEKELLDAKTKLAEQTTSLASMPKTTEELEEFKQEFPDVYGVVETVSRLQAEARTAEKIPIKISRGEAVIPGILVKYIGLEKLEKMNNRGLKAREQRESEEAPVEMAAAPSAQEDLLAQIQPVA